MSHVRLPVNTMPPEPTLGELLEPQLLIQQQDHDDIPTTDSRTVVLYRRLAPTKIILLINFVAHCV